MVTGACQEEGRRGGWIKGGAGRKKEGREEKRRGITQDGVLG